MARAIGTDHHEVVIGMDDFFNALPQLIWHEDEPITWPSSVSLTSFRSLAAEQVKVVLTGEGSDELFAGYERYRFTCLNRQLDGRYRSAVRVRRGVDAKPALPDRRCFRPDSRRKLRHTFLGRGEDDRVPATSIISIRRFSALRSRSRLLLSTLPHRTMHFCEYWNSAHPDASLPGAHALCRSEDVSGGAADEAGPDEHGLLHRKPRAVSGSSLCRIRGRACRIV